MRYNIKSIVEEYLGMTLKSVQVWEKVLFVVPLSGNPQFVNKELFLERVFSSDLK